MKTKPMGHQLAALERLEGRSSFGLLMEQGTGKTWTQLADAERAYYAGKIDCLLILAPRGVHTNWVRREIPAHLEAAYKAWYWSSSAGVRHKRELENALNGPRGRLRILAVNYDALLTPKVRDFVLRFIHSALVSCMVIADESHHLKNAAAKRTEHATALARHARARRILTGTMITDNPGDAFGQFHFLKEGLIGTTSYRSFMAEYAQLVNSQNPTTQSDYVHRASIKNNPRLAFATIVAKDDITGRPIYRNLDRLAEIVARNSFRVTKAECLDLPPKLYTTTYFELEGPQLAAYQLMEDECRILLEDGSLEPVRKLSALIKLQQITSGYVVVPGREEPLYVAEDNARVKALGGAIEDVQGSVIVWAKFRPEITAICAMLRERGETFVEYHGGVSEADREEAIDRFQAGDARFFVANAAAGGAGITLTRAQTAIYFSNSFNAAHRWQSEDRNHRIGTVGEHILYIDLACVGTIDESITDALQSKKSVAAQIYNDRAIDARAVDFGDN